LTLLMQVVPVLLLLVLLPVLLLPVLLLPVLLRRDPLPRVLVFVGVLLEL
jgi:hypothetical protein